MEGLGPGTVLGGRYTAHHRTAQWGGSERWVAQDGTLSRQVVVLCLPVTDPRSAPLLDAARRAASVDTAQLVRILDVGRDERLVYVVEEDLAGAQDLAALLAEGSLPADEVRRITGELATALESASHRGLHHLVLVPEDVLRTPDGQVKLRGLALAAVLAGKDGLEPAAAARTDAVGVVALAYAGLTGLWPLRSRGSVVPPAPVVIDGPAAPSELAAGVPRDLDALCRLTLCSDQGPVSPGDYARQIAPWPSRPVSNVPSLAEPEAPTERLRRIPVSVDREPVEQFPVREDEPTPSVNEPPAAAPAEPVADSAAVPAAAATSEPAEKRSEGSAEEEAIRRSLQAWRPDPPVAASWGPEPTEPVAALRTPPAPATPAPAPVTPTRPAAAAPPVTLPRTPAPRPERAEPAADRGVRATLATVKDRIQQVAESAADQLSTPAGDNLGPPAPLVPEEPLTPRESRLALGIVGGFLALALVVGVWGVKQIGANTTIFDPQPSSTVSFPTPKTSAPQTPGSLEPLAILGADGFDPQGDGAEYNNLAPKVFDDNAETSWHTETYKSAELGGIKKGAGLIVDLGPNKQVRQIQVAMPIPADIEVYLTQGDTLTGATKVGAKAGASGTTTFDVPEGTPGQYIVVWFTKLTQDSQGRFRGYISEIKVLG